MKGADEFAPLFKTGQYGRLYIVSSRHARGLTFRIYVLPAGEVAKPNGEPNGPLNADAVEVYGVVEGQPGWAETYGWLHKGRWQQDFEALVEAKRELRAKRDAEKAASDAARATSERERAKALLATY